MIRLSEIVRNIYEADIPDDKMIKYKDDEGESKEMKASSAKKMEKEHPAKIAYDKIADKGDDDSEKDSGGKLGGGDFDRDGEDEPDMDSDDDMDDEDDDKNASEKENEKLEKELQDIAKDKGLTVGSEDANHGGEIHSLVGKDDDPDNVLGFHAAPNFDDDGNMTDEPQYAIEIGMGSSPMYFDSKEEADAALKKLLDDEKIRKAMDGEGDDTLFDLGDHANSIAKGGDDGADDVEPVKYKFGKGIPTSSDVKVDQETKDTILQDFNPPRDAERDENGLPTNEEDWDKEMTEVESMFEKARDAYEAAEKDASDAAFDDDEEEADYLSDRATQALVQYEKYKKVRDAYEAKGEELGVFESVKINGKMYKRIKESKKPNPRFLKENYDRIFRSRK